MVKAFSCESKLTDHIDQSKHLCAWILELLLSAYKNAEEKAALCLAEFSIAIPKPLACGFSVALRDSSASLQLFQAGEKALNTGFLKHWKGWQARRQTGGVILNAYLYALQIRSCSFPHASVLRDSSSEVKPAVPGLARASQPAFCAQM